MLRIPTPFVPRVPAPNREGVVRVGTGRRRLGWAEFGDPDGRLVLWCHGTPGARRQVPLVGRRAAEHLGLRVVCVERPGVGSSTGHKYERIADFGVDAAAVADDLGHDRFVFVRFGAIAHDMALFGRHWGFELTDVGVPVRWWHGGSDNFVPLDHANRATSRIPDCELQVRPGESHLGGFAVADQVLEAIDRLWPRQE